MKKCPLKHGQGLKAFKAATPFLYKKNSLVSPWDVAPLSPIFVPSSAPP